MTTSALIKEQPEIRLRRQSVALLVISTVAGVAMFASLLMNFSFDLTDTSAAQAAAGIISLCTGCLAVRSLSRSLKILQILAIIVVALYLFVLVDNHSFAILYSCLKIK